MPASYVFKLLAGLHKQAPWRDFDALSLAIARPDVQARVAAATMNRHCIEVVVEAGENRVKRAEARKVTRGRREQVRRASHAVANGTRGKPETERREVGHVADGGKQL